MTEAHIEAPWRAAAFLAQLSHESVDLTVWTEYGQFAGERERYKGRGPIQLTWRANYRACGIALGLPLEAQPELVLRPEVGFRTAAWFWVTHALNLLADDVEKQGRPPFDEISRRINGRAAKQVSLDDRWRRFERCIVVMQTPTIVAPL